MTTETQETQETQTTNTTSDVVPKETGESSTTTTAAKVTKGEGAVQDKDNPDTKDKDKDKDKDSRFGIGSIVGIAGKPATRVSFRILTNLSLSFKPYCGLNSEQKLSIKPGGVENAVKPFKSTVGSKQYKKVGIRITYSFKQLLSIRHRDKCKALPSDVLQIADVFEEGLGDFETLTDRQTTITLETSMDLVAAAPSKLRKAKTPSDATTTTTTTSTTTTTIATTTTAVVNPVVVPDARDEAASFRQKETLTPAALASKIPPRLTLSQRSSLHVNKTGEDSTPSSASATKAMKSISEKPALSALKKESAKASIGDITQHMASATRAQAASSTATAKQVSSTPLSSRTARKAWGRGAKQLDPMARLTAQITVRLNKITLDNFDTLSQQIITIFESEIVSTEQLTRLVSLIFEKTVQEHVYGPLYAQLCVALASKNKSFEEAAFEDGRAVVKQVDFKNVMVKVCQTEFSKGKRAAVITEEMDETDRANEVIKTKNILLGTMKFIGQLYLKELLPAQIMTVCLRHLVVSAGGTGRLSEDDLEGACTLLKTVGSTLDADASINKSELSKYYNKLKSVEKNSREYSVRIRMLIQNLVHLRRQNWRDANVRPSEAGLQMLSTSGDASGGGSGNASTTFDAADDPFGMFDVDAFVRGVKDVSSEITTAVPVPGHLVGAGAQARKKTRVNNRYVSSSQFTSDISPLANSSATATATTAYTRKPRDSSSGNGGGGGGGRRRLLQTTTEEQEVMADNDFGGDKNTASFDDYDEKTQATSTATGGSGGTVGIGERKLRMSLAQNSQRPCDSGKQLDDEQLDEFMGDFLHLRNEMNETKMLETLKRYQLTKRVQFVHKFAQQAIDGGKGERLANFLPKLLDAYIVVADEVDGGLMEFFKGYTYEDNPQLARNTSQLLAGLIVDHEVAFDRVLQWSLLDTRQHQDEDELQFYNGDGVRNYSKGSQTITVVLVLLAELLKELKEACFEDGEYVRKLLVKYRFSIDAYLNQQDVGKRDQIKEEWIKTYGLKFAF